MCVFTTSRAGISTMDYSMLFNGNVCFKRRDNLSVTILIIDLTLKSFFEQNAKRDGCSFLNVNI